MNAVRERPHRSRIPARLLLLPLLGLAATCTDSAGPDRVLPREVLLEVAGGAGQSGIPNTHLEEPLVVRAVDLDGVSRPGVSVTWQVVEGGGIVTPLDDVTDAEGLARADWRLGALGWFQAVDATAGRGKATFSVLAEPHDWTWVMDIRPSATAVDGVIRAQVTIENRWVSHLRFNHYGNCYVRTAHLYAADGTEISGFGSLTLCGPGWVAIPPDYILTAALWGRDAGDLEPGLYAVVFHFNQGLLVNDRVTPIPPLTTTVVVE